MTDNLPKALVATNRRRPRTEVLAAARSIPRSPDGATLGEPHVVVVHDECDNRGGACLACRTGGAREWRVRRDDGSTSPRVRSYRDAVEAALDDAERRRAYCALVEAWDAEAAIWQTAATVFSRWRGCPECAAVGPHADNGLARADERAYCCRQCGEQWDAVFEA